MQVYCESLTEYRRLKTREVKIGDLLIGSGHPIALQTMTTKDTMDTIGTVEETIRCIDAGAQLVRITAPSKKEAENLLHIKNELKKRGKYVPLVADIHFTPNAAEVAARIVEKVRVNPGNYVDKKKFQQIEYTDAEYAEEIDRIRNRFIPLIHICKEYGTAMRIGTNHGSLSDRIMSRYGDTPIGMVESAMEFLRIARDENYHQIVLSMKASNTQVMVQAYRLLIKQMNEEFGDIYPLHLGVTEAGDGEDGRVKSAVGIGTLLEDGIGDTIRVSLTEDPELEIPVCRDLVKRYAVTNIGQQKNQEGVPALSGKTEDTTQNLNGKVSVISLPYDPFRYNRRNTFEIANIGGKQVPVVIADLSHLEKITPQHLESVGYRYDPGLDKWNISDMAADYIFTGNQLLDFDLPGTIKVIVFPAAWQSAQDKEKYYPLFEIHGYSGFEGEKAALNFVMIDCFSDDTPVNDFSLLNKVANDPSVVLCLSSKRKNAMQAIRRMFIELMKRGIQNPAIVMIDSGWDTADDHLIHFSTEAGALLIDGMGDGVALGLKQQAYEHLCENYANASGRNYQENNTPEQFLNASAFSVLQAARTRISKTEYISCPSCGRTLFDLQETTAKIRAVTHHLKGVKIAIMGCIVNGPGEMADADFGYVGSGVGKITLYKGKDVVKRNVGSDIAVDELINLLKENNAWVEKE